MNNITQEIKKLQEKAIRYENIQGRYVEYGKKLNSIIIQLKDLLKDMDPLINLKLRKTLSSRTDYTEQLEELYNYMKTGGEITSKYIRKLYHFSQNEIAVLRTKLQKLSRVKKRKTGFGAEVALYIQKEE